MCHMMRVGGHDAVTPASRVAPPRRKTDLFGRGMLSEGPDAKKGLLLGCEGTMFSMWWCFVRGLPLLRRHNIRRHGQHDSESRERHKPGVHDACSVTRDVCV